ncbi:hypothetical protein CPLU01_10770 [Colletotrichum plurivorum]|uniref:PD-(D/E)XK nuclease-like domain-containing protein n=1 Tax=Colletotrichum plurivorum TaxID=2175906 RepID=A0A8H6K4E9_9PEZI|nr:hypothetical protein CPLU01_10770 [Colletotrichum plurivorum]
MTDEISPKNRKIVEWIDSINNSPLESTIPTNKSSSVAPTDNKLKHTPRGSKSQRPNLPARRPSQASRASKVSSTSRVSPTKQIADRQNKPSPALLQQFNPDDPGIPSSLRRIWAALSSFAKGRGVISRSKEDEIAKAKEESARFESIDGDWFFSSNSTRVQLGLSPSIKKVIKILNIANICANEKYDEASWNSCVYLNVLKLVVPLSKAEDDSVFFLPCPTAKILDDYVDCRGGPRKIDFCFAVEPGPQAIKAITAIQYEDDLFSTSINHTDYQPLRCRPIVLSIESKPEGSGTSDGKAQLLIWLEAQWRQLHRLASRVDPPRSLPDFLPAIIIEGHKWYFLACTSDEGKTVLWSELLLGTTQEALGIYSTVCCLQYFSRWITSDYWPAFQRLLSPTATPAATPNPTPIPTG